MKYAIISIILLISVGISGRAQTEQALFQMPVVPDSIENLYDRADYLMAHYWDFCDAKKAFSTRERFRMAVLDFFNLMPYGTVSGAETAIKGFMKKVSTGKEQVQFVADVAEATFYSDTASIQSDQLYLMFLDEFIHNKKLDKNAKLRYEHQRKVLAASQPGVIPPAFEYTDVLGQHHTFAADTTKSGTILFFNDPDCGDCSMARLRIDADVLSRSVIEKGMVDFVSIYAGEPDDSWLAQATLYPASWKVGAAPDVDQLLDLRYSPVFYVLNKDGSILVVTNSVDNIINILSRLAQVSGVAPSAYSRRSHQTPEPAPAPATTAE